MAEIILTETASVSPPAAGTVSIYPDNTANPQVMMRDDTAAALPLLDQRNTVTAILNKTFTNPTFTAGTTALPAFTLPSGTNMTTPTSGSIEYDGKAIYGTTAANSNRGVIPTVIFSSLTGDVTAGSNNTANAMFAAANDVLTVQAATSYIFECAGKISTTGTTSHQLGFLFPIAGGGSYTSFNASYMVTTAATDIQGAGTGLGVVVSTVIYANAAAASATYHTFQIKGLMRVNAGGTITPSWQWSASPTGNTTIYSGTYFAAYPIGSNTIAAIGAWA